MKKFIKILINQFLKYLNFLFPSSLDQSINRFAKHKIDDIYVYFLILGKNSRSRSNFAYNKEPDTMKWIDSFEKNSCFVDIGSNIGVFSIYAAIKKKCYVHAFEPSINANYLFLINTAKNKISDIVKLYPVLITDDNTNNYLETSIINDNCDNLSGFQFLNSENFQKKLSFKKDHSNYFVPSYKLDDIVFDRQIDYIKIDVDGNELQVLKSSIETLKKPTVKSLLIELDEMNSNYRKIILLLSSLNYEIDNSFTNLTRKSNKPNQLRYNHFFKKKGL